MRRLAVILVAMATLVLPIDASATFPGNSGKIAYYNGSSTYNVFTVNPDGSGSTQLTSGSNNIYPAWSPDGSKLAFASNRDGNYEIYVMDADGSNQTRITTNPATDSQPAWSPDGRRMVFTTNRDGNYELYVMNSDGSGETRITNTPEDDGLPDWSPDGTLILFGSGQDVYTIAPDGSGRTLRLAESYEATWAPGGQVIWSWWQYYDEVLEDYFSEIQFLDLQTPEYDTYQFTNYPSEPVVSPEDNEVLFHDATYQNFHFWGIRERWGQTREIDIWGYAPDWQPLHRGYVRPKGATPMRVPLVPAAKQCTSPNNTHGSPLAFPSCGPPVTEASATFLGIGDGDPAPAKSIGFVLLKVQQPADLSLRTQITNVMHPDRSDYTGELRLELPLRITDRFNKPHPNVTGPGTGDTSFYATVPCAATADTTIGATCSLTSTANAVLPGSVREGARAVWGLGQVKLHDGGPDEDAETPADNGLLAVQGVFIP